MNLAIGKRLFGLVLVVALCASALLARIGPHTDAWLAARRVVSRKPAPA